MSLKEKINVHIGSNGVVGAVQWKPQNLKRMYLPNRSIVRIPNPVWDRTTFPMENYESLVGDIDVMATFNVHVPMYRDNLNEIIAGRLQNIAYDEKDDDREHNEAAIRTIVEKLSRGHPTLDLSGDKLLGEYITISGYARLYEESIRFTKWSIFPADLIQIRIIWNEEMNPATRVIFVDIDLAFNHRKIDSHLNMIVNRQGRLWFNAEIWKVDFNRPAIIEEELPQLDPLKTPPYTTTISSDEEEKPPAKRSRFASFGDPSE